MSDKSNSNLPKSRSSLQKKIIQVLTTAGKLRTRELYNRLHRPDDYDDFKSLLTDMLENKEIRRAAKRTWCLPRTERDTTAEQKTQPGITGTLHLNSGGNAFIMLENGVERLFIRRAHLAGAVQGDTVQVDLTSSQQRGRSEGKVLRILQRGMKQLVGRIERYGRRYVLIPMGVPLTETVFIRHTQIALEEGLHVLVQLVYLDSPKGRTRLEADVIRTYAEASRAELLQETIRCSYLLQAEFSPEVLTEVEQLDDSVRSQKRRDLRGETVFTIDPHDARDFDDAVSLEPLPKGGFRLGVHIADVSHYVKPGTEVDREAWQRGTSAYLVGEVIPMLPHRLSTNLCSLRENEDRYTMSCVIDYDERGNQSQYKIFPSVIRSSKRYTYQEVQALLERFPRRRKQGFNPELEYSDPIERSLYYMNLLFRKLLKQRQKAGSLDFSSPEPRFELDNTGMPVAVEAVEQLDSHRLIEEFMLAANRVVAEHMQNAKVPAVYRVHDAPIGEKLSRFTEFMRHLGVALDPGSLQEITTWQRIMKDFSGSDSEFVLQQVVLRSMMKAGYTTENRGHFGLAFKTYTHFTSPIRRYPDLLVHRVLKKLANGEAIPEPELKKAARNSSMREINAMEAERESTKIKQLLYLENKVGERFRGVVRGIERFGLFVEVADILADGLVPVAALDDDYYVYDEKEWTLTGRRKGVRYAIGQSLFVEVTRCSVDERKLDLKIVESLQQIVYHDSDPKNADRNTGRVKPAKGRKTATRDRAPVSRKKSAVSRKSPAGKSGGAQRRKRQGDVSTGTKGSGRKSSSSKKGLGEL